MSKSPSRTSSKTAGKTAGETVVESPSQIAAEARGDAARFTDAERELLLEAAQAVVRRGMAVPAMMFLETMAPMNTVSSSMLMILSPVWRVALPASRIDAVAKILERRAAIPELLAIIDDEEDKRLRDQSEQRARRRGQRRRWFQRRRNDKQPTASPSADERRGA